MEKFKNKYRIPSARLQSWNYGNNGAYFITICTQNMKHLFGKIVNSQMQLNELGKIAEKYWKEIPNHFTFVELENFVVMPNHIHGILVIDKSAEVPINLLRCNVYRENLDNNKLKNRQMSKISPKPGSISTIIRSYKSVVSKNARKIHADFGWQARFHDHIIRNAMSFERIQYYIEQNPSQWNKDKFYG